MPEPRGSPKGQHPVGLPRDSLLSIHDSQNALSIKQRNTKGKGKGNQRKQKEKGTGKNEEGKGGRTRKGEGKDRAEKKEKEKRKKKRKKGEKKYHKLSVRSNHADES